MGVTALLTSWASWIGSLHGGNQSTNYTVSNNLSAEANSEYNTAMKNYMQDMMIWNQINEVLLDQQFAEESGDDLAAEKAEWRLDQLLNDNVTDSFLDAINWALEQEEAGSPFEMEGYVESYFDTYYDLIDEGGYCESDGYMYTDIDRIKKHFSGEKSQKMLRTIGRFSKRTFS